MMTPSLETRAQRRQETEIAQNERESSADTMTRTPILGPGMKLPGLAYWVTLARKDNGGHSYETV